jgi:hypothetical protein
MQVTDPAQQSISRQAKARSIGVFVYFADIFDVVSAVPGAARPAFPGPGQPVIINPLGHPAGAPARIQRQ